jgi:hypothetical protein
MHVRVVPERHVVVVLLLFVLNRSFESFCSLYGKWTSSIYEVVGGRFVSLVLVWDVVKMVGVCAVW